MKSTYAVITSALFVVVCAALSGCAEVKPWQRGNLARSHMALDTDPLESQSKQHMYFSKEGSSGGYGVGGGGCGCN
jgi:hypothetical protein